MVINISNYDNDTFQGTIQIQSSRPIFNSSYESSVYNYIDKDFSFKYQEFQNKELQNQISELQKTVSEMDQISKNGAYSTHGFRESTGDKLKVIIFFIGEW